MGRPFSSELEKISDTYLWATQQQISDLSEELLYNNRKPLFIVGSGGSLSACHYLAMLYQQQGVISKAITPLELFYSKNAIKDCNVLFISASGRNTDILFAYNIALECEPSRLFSVCMKKNSPLSKLASTISIGKNYDYDLPSGKDGFLATNSLIAFFTIFNKCFSIEGTLQLETDIKETISFVEKFVENIDEKFTFTVLYGGWGQPVAIDLESKLAEAALGNVLVSDYRNFGHGRHNWFDKRNKTSAIIALVSPKEEQLAVKTLDLLPKEIPVLWLKSKRNDSLSSIELLIQSFYFIQRLGRIQGIDPGRPGVPDFGSKLYHLNYKKFYSTVENNLEARVKTFIQRKLNSVLFEFLSATEKKYWKDSYANFYEKLISAEFGALVFDYDGTICSALERYTGINPKMSSYLNKFLELGIVIGIATGRGKSVRETLQNAINKKYWKQVIIGYYNCSDFGLLSDNDVPNKALKTNHNLKKVFDAIKNNDFGVEINPELKPHQITIEINDKKNWNKVRSSIIQFVLCLDIKNVRILESSHSMDIIDHTVSTKLNILEHCIKLSSKKKLASNCLCIGDKGNWPGNDYHLLSSDYSLSVDEVSSLNNSCWNLAKPGIKNTEATLYYLSCLCFNKRGLQIKI